MVTAETALVLPTLVAVLVLALQVLALGVDTLRCVDAARAGARAAARGDDARPRALAVAPTGSTVTVRRSGPDVVVVVQAPRAAPWVPVGLAPRARAVAAVEQPDGPPEQQLDGPPEGGTG